MYKRHEGDDLLSADKRLVYLWQWDRIASGISESEIKRWTHFQSSSCEVGGWSLEVSQWGNNDSIRYEAQISYAGDTVLGCSNSYSKRIDAQIAVEKLLVTWIEAQYNLIVVSREVT